MLKHFVSSNLLGAKRHFVLQSSQGVVKILCVSRLVHVLCWTLVALLILDFIMYLLYPVVWYSDVADMLSCLCNNLLLSSLSLSSVFSKSWQVLASSPHLSSPLPCSCTLWYLVRYRHVLNLSGSYSFILMSLQLFSPVQPVVLVGIAWFGCWLVAYITGLL